MSEKLEKLKSALKSLLHSDEQTTVKCREAVYSHLQNIKDWCISLDEHVNTFIVNNVSVILVRYITALVLCSVITYSYCLIVMEVTLC